MAPSRSDFCKEYKLLWRGKYHHVTGRKEELVERSRHERHGQFDGMLSVWEEDAEDSEDKKSLSPGLLIVEDAAQLPWLLCLGED
jgi:hypothetical protein